MVLLFSLPTITIFAFLFGQAYIRAHLRTKQNLAKAQPFTPENTLILFDLHGVVFKHDFKRMLVTFLKSPQKWQFMKDMLNPCLLWDIMKLLYRRPIPESFFMHLAHNYKQIRAVLPLLIEIANCQKINHSMLGVITKLKQNGYEIALLSNIGQNIYTDLLCKHPDIFHLFDHIMVSRPETNYASKPSPEIYELFFDEINPTNKQVIMIDDKQKNLCGALQFGIIGILFKNTAELEKQLTALKVY